MKNTMCNMMRCCFLNERKGIFRLTNQNKNNYYRRGLSEKSERPFFVITDFNKRIMKANNILEKEFKQLYNKIEVTLPDEKSRRVGQSIAAASLPKIQKEGSQ